MKEWSPLMIGLVAGATAALASAGTIVYLKMRRRKSPAELERLRRLYLGRSGRIATGEIMGLVEPEAASEILLVYRYDVAGVTYEVAQDVSVLPEIAATAKLALGGIATIRYEMKQPSNSIVVSEEWSGLPTVKSSGDAEIPVAGRTAENA